MPQVTQNQEPAPTKREESIEILEAVTGKHVRFKINNRPSSNDAWVGIYPLMASDQDHGEENKRWKWLRNIDVNNASFPKQSEGDWSIRVFSDGGHTLHERKDFTVKAEPLDPAAVQSIRKNVRIALVIGTILFSMGLPLFIVGNITDGEDNLAMIIPGAIMFGVGAFVVVSASFVLISSRSKSNAETDKPAPTDSSYSIKLEDMSFWDDITEGSEDTRSYHDKLLEKMKYPDKEEIEQDIQSGKSLQKWYSHWLHDPVKSAEIAKALGLVVGGAGHDFEGPWGTKGLYAYRSGKYSGHAYFGTGGSDEDRLEPEDDDDKYRPWDRNDPKTPENIRKIWLEIEPRLARSYYLDPSNDD